MWLEEESSGGGSSPSKAKMAAVAGGGLVGTAVLGKALAPVAKRLARKTGLPQSQVQMLLTAAAPVIISAVTAAVAKRKHAQAVPGEVIDSSGQEHGGGKEAKGLLGTHRHR
ncbi:hypothetical protein GCM10022221_16910 [Actinocorallia aurea]